MSATVEKALLIVETLSKSQIPIGVSELGRKLGMNKSTIFRLLDTLCRRGYTRKDPASSGYVLTTKLWELGVGVLQKLTLRDVARPVMEAVTLATGETTMVGVMQDGDALILEKVDSPAALQIASPLGSRVALQSSSIGRAMLAFQTEEFVDKAIPSLQPRTEFTISSREALATELDRIRHFKVAECIDEWAIGVSGISAPVRDQSGKVVGSFCITGPTSRFTSNRLPALRSETIAAAQEISSRMGFQSNAETLTELTIPGSRQKDRTFENFI